MTAALAVLLAPAAGGLRLGESRRPVSPSRWPGRAALLAVILSLAAAAGLATVGSGTSPILGIGELGLLVRIDVIFVILMVLASVMGWVILRFAATNLLISTRN